MESGKCTVMVWLLTSPLYMSHNHDFSHVMIVHFYFGCFVNWLLFCSRIKYVLYLYVMENNVVESGKCTVMVWLPICNNDKICPLYLCNGK